MKALIAIFAVLGFLGALVATLVYAGFYDIAADDPHWGVTGNFIEAARERSIERQSGDVGTPPALDDPSLLAMGAEHYDEMCVECHLAPGKEENELRAGLNPKPPKLAAPGDHRTPEHDFWIIKHGIKMTAMPAWGVTHDDRSIWAMTAFVQKLPGLSRAEYDLLVANGRAEGHSHEGGEHHHDD